MTSFPWRQHLNVNTDPNCKLKHLLTLSYTLCRTSYQMKPKDLFLVIPLDNQTIEDNAQ